MQKSPVNLIVLAIIVIISALAARGFLKAPEAKPVALLEADLQQCLAEFWRVRPEVGVSGPETAASAKVDVPLPQVKAWQRQWTHPLIAFVARRHEKVKLVQVAVSSQGLPVVATPPPAPQSGAFTDPVYFEAARAELLQRNSQRSLDQKYGPGVALVLVDVTAAVETTSANLAAPQVEAKREAPMKDSLAPREAESAPESSLEGARRVSQPQQVTTVSSVEARIVCLQAPPAGLEDEVRQALGGPNLQLQVVILPPTPR